MRATGWVWIVPLAMLAACGNGETSQAAQTTDTATAAGQPASGAAAPAGVPVSATPAAAPQANGSLSAYVDKFPFEKVGGYSWRDNPTVRAAIDKTVSDVTARNAILTVEGPSSAITMRDGRVSQWGCQQHNCGDHQWLVEIAPDGASARVCYFDKAKDAKARWFHSDGKVESRGSNCNLE